MGLKDRLIRNVFNWDLIFLFIWNKIFMKFLIDILNYIEVYVFINMK